MSLATLLLGMAAVAAAESSRLVPAAAKPDAEWKNYPTRTLEDFPGLAAASLSAMETTAEVPGRRAATAN